MKNMRHVVNVMRPSATVGSRGETQGQPETVVKNWPCSIEAISGREIQQARTAYAEATHKVEGYGNPNKPLKATDYLTGGSIGARVLQIGFINDFQQNGVSLSLLCGERVA